MDNSWADGRGATVADQQRVDDVGFITTLVAQLTRQYGVDPGHVFATGMSDGAFMTNRLGCERADVFAAIAPVSGTLGVNVACNPSRPVAVLETHGTADKVVPFDGGLVVGRAGPSAVLAAPAMIAKWRTLDGCKDPATEETLPGAPNGNKIHRFTSGQCAGATAVVFNQIDGGGHTWPGEASAASAQFFATHAR